MLILLNMRLVAFGPTSEVFTPKRQKTKQKKKQQEKEQENKQERQNRKEKKQPKAKQQQTATEKQQGKPTTKQGKEKKRQRKEQTNSNRTSKRTRQPRRNGGRLTILSDVVQTLQRGMMKLSARPCLVVVLLVMLVPEVACCAHQRSVGIDSHRPDVRFFTFKDPSLRNALLGSMLLGVCCGLMGAFLVVRKLSLLGDALSHAVLPGVAWGFLEHV